MPSIAAPSPRRADLDWIRITAFGLLILYHVGLVYGPWDWHVRSRHTFDWIREATLITAPWRLTLLFLVSGAALRLMSRKFTAGGVLKARAARLIPPFLFGVLVLVPPQAWLEALDKGSWHAGFVAWWVKSFSPSGIAAGVPLNHLWFVLYIAVYSLVAVALLARPRWMAVVQNGLVKVLSDWRLLVLPILYLAIARQLLFHQFGITNQLLVDWYNHAMSLGVFLFGFLLVGHEPLWKTLEKLRWVSLALAAVSLPLLMALEAHPGGMAFNGWVKNSMFAINQWVTISAILGFGSRHIRNADSPFLRYLTEAVFPCYLAHQTILVIAIFLLKPLGVPSPLEAMLLVAITLGGSVGAYELARRSGPLRPLMGLKRLPPKAARRPTPVLERPAPSGGARPEAA